MFTTGMNVEGMTVISRIAILLVAVGVLTAPACTLDRGADDLGDQQMEHLPYEMVSAPMEPEPFAPHVFSTDKSKYALHLHSSLYFSPDGSRAFFTHQHRPPEPNRNTVIMQMTRLAGGWSLPEPVPFGSEYSELTGWFSPDGGRFYFGSVRPLPGNSEPEPDLRLWITDWTMHGWTDPINISSFSQLTIDHGPLYIFGDWAGGHGSTDIYRLDFENGCYASPKNMGPPVNSCHEDYPALASPDGGYLIIYRTDAANREITGLYISFRTDDGWTHPSKLPYELGESFDASLSPDGSVLFFLLRGKGVYWVDSGIIDDLRVNDLGLGEALSKPGKTEGAVANCRRCQETNPNYRNAVGVLESPHGDRIQHCSNRVCEIRSGIEKVRRS